MFEIAGGILLVIGIMAAIVLNPEKFAAVILIGVILAVVGFALIIWPWLLWIVGPYCALVGLSAAYQAMRAKKAKQAQEAITPGR